MLSHLQVRDFALVDHLELEFGAGMSAITGETGAGKSIMLDALGLLLGERADSEVVRVGAERAEIAAGFDIDSLPAVRAWLAERDLENDDECHLRRQIAASGRSRCYINGISQPLQALKTLGDLLVDIHGQHDNQSLLKRDLQRQLLDDYAGQQSLLKRDRQRQVLDDFAGHQKLLADVLNCYRRWNDLSRQLERIKQAGNEQDARIELLQFQVQELDRLGLGVDELPALEGEHKRLANAEQLLDATQRALNQLYESEEASVHGVLGRVLGELAQLPGAERDLSGASELLNSALIQTQEASDELRRYLQTVELDPARLQWVEQRLADIYSLARKHRVEPAELGEKFAEARVELDQLANSDQHGESLQREIEETLATYHALATELGRQRQAAAVELSDKVSASLGELGMPGGRFEIALNPETEPTASGLESVDFQVSANPGQPVRPLPKVASGGELSRISLAIHVITANTARIPTLIFDEVDTGIGGAVAEVVGRHLRALGGNRQVLCVTHLPQVAAQAHRQYRVSKQTDGKVTQTHVEELEGKQRAEEIARMLGGVKLTKNTLAHAREMIAKAAN